MLIITLTFIYFNIYFEQNVFKILKLSVLKIFQLLYNYSIKSSLNKL